MTSKATGATSFRPIILSVLDQKDSYGYEIMLGVCDLSGNTRTLKPGVLYPLLRRLEQHGLIEGYWVQKDGHRPRRYYRLMEAGRKVLAEEKA